MKGGQIEGCDEQMKNISERANEYLRVLGIYLWQGGAGASGTVLENCEDAGSGATADVLVDSG